MKKQFEEISIEVIDLENEDIIATSGSKKYDPANILDKDDPYLWFGK